jgi:hypothetical protein
MYDKIAFAKIGWYKDYNYCNEDRGDLPRGRHEYIQRVGDAHERFNFQRMQDRTYGGYVHWIGKYKGLPNPDEPTGWLVIWVAAYEGTEPLMAVGLYADATFLPEYKKRPVQEFGRDAEDEQYVYCVSATRAQQIPVDERQEFPISGAHFRRSSIVYVRGGRRSEPWRDELAHCAEEIVEQYPPLSAGQERRVRRHRPAVGHLVPTQAVGPRPAGRQRRLGPGRTAPGSQ